MPQGHTKVRRKYANSVTNIMENESCKLQILNALFFFNKIRTVCHSRMAFNLGTLHLEVQKHVML